MKRENTVHSPFHSPFPTNSAEINQLYWKEVNCLRIGFTTTWDTPVNSTTEQLTFILFNVTVAAAVSLSNHVKKNIKNPFMFQSCSHHPHQKNNNNSNPHNF